MEYAIIITVSNQAANIVGKLSKCTIAMLHQAEYSVIRQEGECGYGSPEVAVIFLSN